MEAVLTVNLPSTEGYTVFTFIFQPNLYTKNAAVIIHTRYPLKTVRPQAMVLQFTGNVYMRLFRQLGLWSGTQPLQQLLL